jgi:hypothetical protein
VRAEDAGIVDQDIDPTELGHRGVNRLLHALWLGDIQVKCYGVATGSVRSTGSVDGVSHDLCLVCKDIPKH